MKLRVAVGLSLVFFSFVLLSQGRPQDSNHDERLILALETAWSRAEQTKDAVALDQLLSPRLIYIDYDGSISRTNKGKPYSQCVASQSTLIQHYILATYLSRHP